VAKGSKKAPSCHFKDLRATYTSFMRGSIALVGSGEFLPIMADFEESLINDGIKNGKAAKYVQIPTAAGQESTDRLKYWEELGNRQAALLNVEPHFLPIFTRDDAFNLNLLPNLRVIPHFDKFFRWIPDSAAKVLMHAPEGTVLLGIDELTALVQRSGEENWLVHGEAKVHILQGAPKQELLHGELIKL